MNKQQFCPLVTHVSGNERRSENVTCCSPSSYSHQYPVHEYPRDHRAFLTIPNPHPNPYNFQQIPSTPNQSQPQLWQFLLDLLSDISCQHLISWTGAGWEFKLKEPEKVCNVNLENISNLQNLFVCVRLQYYGARRKISQR